MGRGEEGLGGGDTLDVTRFTAERENVTQYDSRLLLIYEEDKKRKR